MSRKLIPIGIASILAIGLIVLFVVIGNAQGDRLLTEARSAVEQREFDKALSILDQHVRTNPGDKEALLLAAQTARRAESHARAAEFLRSYEQNGGAREEVLREERRAKAQSGDKQVAEELLRACEQTPGDASNYLNLEAIVKGFLPHLDAIEAARGRVEEGPELQRAFRAADALVQTPMGTADRAEALFWSGRIHHIGFRYSRGVQDLRQAVELAPQHHQARRYLANTVAQASPDESLVHMEILSRQRPGDVSTLFGLASLYRSLGRTAEAGQVLDELLRDRPEDVLFLVERSLVEIDTGRPAEAEVLLRRAAILAPDHREVLLALSKSLRIQNRTAEADQFLKRCLELDAHADRKMDSMKLKSK